MTTAPPSSAAPPSSSAPTTPRLREPEVAPQVEAFDLVNPRGRPAPTPDRAPGPTAPDLTGIEEVEVSWSDHVGHPLGKRLPTTHFLSVLDDGVPFCDGALAWNVVADIQEGVRLSNWGTGYPNARARPDLDTLRPLPWREGAAHVVADLTDTNGRPVASSPRTVLRRVVDQLAARGYTARVGVELEFYLLGADTRPVQDGLHAYSLDKADQLDPALATITRQLRDFVPVEAVHTEYGPAQVEVNLHHADPLTAADDAFRFRYALRALARRHGLTATFMAKPFNGWSGNSSHLHISLWRGDVPALAAVGDREPQLTRHVVAGLLRHLPGITLYGAPTVNSYKRYEAASFAPATATWGADNRTVAVRSLLEGPASTRVELRSPGADSNPYWTVASALAAVVAGIDEAQEPPAQGQGNQYGQGPALPGTLLDAARAARADETITAILGPDACHDFAVLAESEWAVFMSEVTSWEQDRYLRRV